MVKAQPERLAAAAGELHAINAALRDGSVAAAAPTTGIVPAAGDVVSMLTAVQFASHARFYQAVSVQASALQEQLATVLTLSAGSYGATEAANASVVG